MRSYIENRDRELTIRCGCNRCLGKEGAGLNKPAKGEIGLRRRMLLVGPGLSGIEASFVPFSGIGITIFVGVPCAGSLFIVSGEFLGNLNQSMPFRYLFVMLLSPTIYFVEKV